MGADKCYSVVLRKYEDVGHVDSRAGKGLANLARRRRRRIAFDCALSFLLRCESSCGHFRAIGEESTRPRYRKWGLK